MCWLVLFDHRANPSQSSLINEDSNQRLKDKRYYRSNENNNLPVDDYDNFGEGKHF